MTIAIFCTVIALVAGFIGASPRKASLMAGIVGFVAEFTALAVGRGLDHWIDLYSNVVLSLLIAAAAALMAFAVAKLKR